MTQQQYTPVAWQDETTSQQGTLINAERLNQMQTAHHYADGLEEVDTVPTADPGVAYHKIVYCTADNTLYRWDGEAWTADIDDPTRELLEEHEADHDNPHQVTKSQVGLGNADNTSDMDKPISTATQTALDGKVDKQDSSQGPIAYTADDGTEGSTPINTLAVASSLPIRTAGGRLRAVFDGTDPYADDCVTYQWTNEQLQQKADKATTYTKSETDTLLGAKADKATTLAGYGITDAYTKTEADTLLGAKADQATTYTKVETDSLLAGKANASQLTDGSVTKVGTANIGSDTKPIKLVAGVPTAVTYDLAKDNAVVHLAGAETIPGAKTFSAVTNMFAINYERTGGYLEQCKISTEERGTVPSSQVQVQPLTINDKDGQQLYFEQYIAGTDGARRFRKNLYTTRGTRVQIEDLWAKSDGTGWRGSPTLPNDAPTNALTTISWVSQTGDSGPNNLLHKHGDETKSGALIMAGNVITQTSINDQSTSYQEQTRHNVLYVDGSLMGNHIYQKIGDSVADQWLVYRKGAYEAQPDRLRIILSISTTGATITGLYRWYDADGQQHNKQLNLATFDQS